MDDSLKTVPKEKNPPITVARTKGKRRGKGIMNEATNLSHKVAKDYFKLRVN